MGVWCGTLDIVKPVEIARALSGGPPAAPLRPPAPLYYSEHMDATIRNLDERAYGELKARAALNGKNIGELQATRCYLARPTTLSKRGSLRDLIPSVSEGGNERLSEQVDAILYGVDGAGVMVLDSSFLVGYHNVLEVTTVLMARRGLDVAARVAAILPQAREVGFVPCSEVPLDILETFRGQPPRIEAGR